MKKNKILAGLATSVIAASMMACIPASASASSSTVYSAPIEGIKITKFDKYLVMEKNAVVPNASFSFTIAAGDAVAGKPDGKTFPVFAGVGTPKFLLSSATEGLADSDEKNLKTNDNSGNDTTATVTFSPADTDNSTVTIAEASVGTEKTVKFSTPSNNADEKYAQKHIAIDFSGVAFPEPGVYRYIITESPAAAAQAAGVTNDDPATRVLDVVVVDSSSGGTSKLSISNYVLHDSVDDVPTKDSAGTAIIAKKSSGFTNKYETYDLQFSKSVSGNQASRDKYFQFNVSIENAKGAEITVDGQGTTFDAAPAKSTNTKYEEDAMSTANTTDSNTTRNGQQLTADTDGKITATFYIRHSQSVKLLGLPAGAKYTVTEAQEDYDPNVTATEANTGDVAVNTAKNGITDSTTGIKGNTTAAFTNTREGNIPTGIFTNVAGSVGIVALGIAGITGGAVYLKKKKSEDE